MKQKTNSSRVVLITAVVVVALAIGGLCAYLYARKNEAPPVPAAQVSCQKDNAVKHPRENPQWPDLGKLADTTAQIGFAEPAQMDQGRGIWIQKGRALNNTELTQALAKKPHVVEFYFDYTCNFCNDFEAQHHDELLTIANSADTILVLRPVVTHNGPMAIPGNEVVAWVAAHHPDKVWNFEQSLSGLTSKFFTTRGLTDLGKIQTKYIDKDAPNMDRLCADVSAGDDDAKGFLAYMEPMTAIDDALGKAGIDPSAVPLPKTAQYSRSASELFQKRYPDSSGTPKLVVDGKELDTNLMSDPQGITKSLKDK